MEGLCHPRAPSYPHPWPWPSHQFESDIIATLGVENIFLRRNRPVRRWGGGAPRAHGAQHCNGCCFSGEADEMWILPHPPLLSEARWAHAPLCLTPAHAGLRCLLFGNCAYSRFTKMRRNLALSVPNELYWGDITVRSFCSETIKGSEPPPPATPAWWPRNVAASCSLAGPCHIHP